jgi:hypothetical protein
MKSQDRATSNYEFTGGGYPTPETVQKAYDDADYCRAVQPISSFFPTVSFEVTWRGNLSKARCRTRSSRCSKGRRFSWVFTPNSDTPYSGLPLDLSNGPMVVELPSGPLMGAANDLNQRWVMDLGLPGPDAGKGGKHVLLPPGYQDKVPDGYDLPPHSSGSRPFRARACRLLSNLRPRGGRLRWQLEAR